MHAADIQALTRANQAWGESGEVSIRARRNGGRPYILKRKIGSTREKRVLVRFPILQPAETGLQSHSISSSFRPNLEQCSGGWRDDTKRRGMSQEITRKEMGLFEDRDSWGPLKSICPTFRLVRVSQFSFYGLERAT